jgi:ABC-2 type transport system ATP-binding protein
MEEAERLCDRVAIVDRGRVIALGAPQQLIASVGADHLIEMAIGDGGPAVDPARLARLDGVRGIRIEEGVLRIQASELHRALPALVDHFARAGMPMGELRTRSATLEDVFVSLTGRHLRDD